MQAQSERKQGLKVSQFIKILLASVPAGKLLIETVTMNMNVYRLLDLDDTAHLSPLLWRNIHNHV